MFQNIIVTKGENSCLLKRSLYSSLVNEPTSVGIGPVSSFSTIKILRREIREQVRRKGRVCFVSKHNIRIETIAKSAYPNQVTLDQLINQFLSELNL